VWRAVYIHCLKDHDGSPFTLIDRSRLCFEDLPEVVLATVQTIHCHLQVRVRSRRYLAALTALTTLR
jgi:hypothetical protein